MGGVEIFLKCLFCPFLDLSIKLYIYRYSFFSRQLQTIQNNQTDRISDDGVKHEFIKFRYFCRASDLGVLCPLMPRSCPHGLCFSRPLLIRAIFIFCSLFDSLHFPVQKNRDVIFYILAFEVDHHKVFESFISLKGSLLRVASKLKVEERD